MLHTYFLSAIRHLRKHKMFAFINTIGLAIGLMACLLIGMFIFHEWRYDRFHVNGDRLARVTMEYQMAGTLNEAASTGTKVGPQLQRVLPGIETYARCFITSRMVEGNGVQFQEDRLLYADDAFFSMFSFPLIEGNAEQALNAPDKVVITRSTALKYFGTASAINKVLTIRDKDYTVSAVCEDAPEHSQIKFDLVTRFLNLGDMVQEEQWWTANWITYLLLKPGQDMAAAERAVNAYMNTPAVRAEARLEGKDYLRYHLQPVTDVHLHSSLAGFEPNGNLKYLYMFGGIALLILLIASANYTNLATAKSMYRSGEIGIRKTLGASRRQVFLQFIGETLVLTLVAAMLASVLAILALPFFSEITGARFSVADILQPLPLSLLAVLTIIISLMAGAYPAMVMSGANTIIALKKNILPGTGKHALRRTLIVLQFGISIFLMAFTVVMLQQMRYMQQKNLGYNREQVLVLPIDPKMADNYSILRDGLKQVPGVVAVSAAYETPEFIEWKDGIRATDEKGIHDISLNALPVDIDFTKTMEMTMVAGRDFVPGDLSLMDTSNNYEHYVRPCIINENLASKIGWTPEQAIGRTIEGNQNGKIVGVVKDFHFQSLQQAVSPLMMFFEPQLMRCFIVRIAPQDAQGTIGRLNEWWKQRISHRPFTYEFLDESYDKLYRSEQRMSLLFSTAASLAIVLACLGLFGLASFSIVQRSREIGIRRVLGASVSGITLLVARQFLWLVLVAVVIALPLAWMAAKQWLQDYAYRIDMPWWVYFTCACGAMILALSTIGVQTIKAATTNPVKSLRTE